MVRQRHPDQLTGELPLVRADTRAATGVAWVVLVLGLVATLLAALGWQGRVDAATAARLAEDIADVQTGLGNRLQDVVDVTSAVGALYDASGEVEPAELTRFVTTLGGDRTLTDRFDGLRGVVVVDVAGSAPVVSTAAPANELAHLTADDLVGSPRVGDAVRRAVDLAVPVTSTPLAPDSRARVGADLVVVTPVYDDPTARVSTARVDLRRDSVRQVVVTLVDADELLSRVAPEVGTELAVVAYDGGDLRTAQRLGSVPVDHRIDPDRTALARTVVVNLEDTTWLLRVEALPGYVPTFERVQPLLVAAAGIALTAALFVLVWVLATSRVRALRMVEEATAELAAANTELREFTGVVSHDLKSPLTGVIGFLDLLGMPDRQLGEEEQGFVAHARASAERMSNLITRLLSYAQAGTLLGRTEPVPLDEVVAEVVRDHQARLDGRGRIVVGDLPIVEGDRGRLTQVFQNVIGNAVKYVPADRSVWVEVGAERAGAGWLIRVADNGVGIAPEDRAAALRPFQRTERTAAIGGHGLGLAIVDRIVTAHGGTVELDESHLGGTEVRIRLPAS